MQVREPNEKKKNLVTLFETIAAIFELLVYVINFFFYYLFSLRCYLLLFVFVVLGSFFDEKINRYIKINSSPVNSKYYPFSMYFLILLDILRYYLISRKVFFRNQFPQRMEETFINIRVWDYFHSKMHVQNFILKWVVFLYEYADNIVI